MGSNQYEISPVVRKKYVIADLTAINKSAMYPNTYYVTINGEQFSFRPITEPKVGDEVIIQSLDPKRENFRYSISEDIRKK